MKKQKRAGKDVLTKIAPLLEDLSRFETLVEKRPGVFFLGRKEFMHFHELPDAIVADVFLPNERLRLPVTTRPEQLDLLDRIWSSIDQPLYWNLEYRAQSILNLSYYRLSNLVLMRLRKLNCCVYLLFLTMN